MKDSPPKDAPARRQAAVRIEAARRTWEAASDLEAIRESFDALFDPGEGAPLGATRSVGGIETERFGAGFTTPQVLFLHGGGYQVGSLRSHRGIMSTLSELSARPVVGVAYRCAPRASVSRRD